MTLKIAWRIVQRRSAERTTRLIQLVPNPPYVVALKYSVITATMYSGTAISLITEDCVSNCLWEHAVGNDHRHRGANGSKLTVVDVFSRDCTVN